MEVLVSVDGLAMDPVTKMPMVILLNEDNTKYLVMWIGALEAVAIAEGLDEGLKRTERPITHDLFKSLIDSLGGKITKIVIHNLKQNHYYASICLVDKEGNNHSKDSRPSDAINSALRFKCSIYVEDKLLSEVSEALKNVASEKESTTKIDLGKLDIEKMHKA